MPAVARSTGPPAGRPADARHRDAERPRQDAAIPDRDAGVSPPDADTQRRGTSGRERDRDEWGRARNARPRDGLGRPLARGAAGQPATPEGPALPPAQALKAAQRLIDSGQPFHAHEVLEAAWKAAPTAERELWRGLAQIAVGLTHAGRGNARGAAALLRRGADRVGPYGPGCPHGVDAAAVVTAAIALATRIDAGGLASLPPPAARLTLYAPPARER